MNIKTLFEKWLVLTTTLVCGFFGAIHPAQADETFWVDLDTTYTVSERGPTQVDHQFTVTNRTPSYFISSYSLQLGSNRINNVVVKLGQQTIPAEVTPIGEQTKVSFEFPDKVVGEGKQLNFSVNYTNPDLAQISGQVLELTVPPLASPDAYRKYTVKVTSPARFGEPTRSTPEPKHILAENNLVEAYFDQSASRGIMSVYGSQQLFQLNLEYPLDNPGSQPILTQITLPPETPTQELYYQSLTPQPTSWKIDVDGNWLASYHLAANEKVTVSAQIIAKLKLAPNSDIPILAPSTGETASAEFWPTTDATILKLAQAHRTPAEIYDFTTQQLTYTTTDLTQDLKRLGAVAALENPTLATCQEYTDVFIALARANNIPARRLVGYAQTQNQKLRPAGLAGATAGDILHAWPEYYDEKLGQWIQVDPTWGDTTGGVDYLHQLDLNHIVFAINGESSVLPYPVGSYKPGEKPGKTINVGFATEFPTSKPELQIGLEPKKLGPLNLPGWYSLTLTNPTGSAWYHLNLQLPDGLNLRADESIPTQILPYQTFTTTVSVYNQLAFAWPNHQPVTVTAQLGDQAIATTSATIYVLPSSLGSFSFPLASLVVGVGLTVSAIGAGRLLLLGLSRAHSLRR